MDNVTQAVDRETSSIRIFTEDLLTLRQRQLDEYRDKGAQPTLAELVARLVKRTEKGR